ncbi:DNA polymerase IV [Albibacterium sp.]|uniref:DNA polymerase IV n=1 Tax=Albibacterium sp. TaxID=2952885 RepID=UPI002CDB028B|nr:DNA polymerase IV [Albibacterium sp.]HUH18782.1 DNA polymerase IV [Albibacterium sp.]
MNDERTYRKIIHIDMDAFFASVEQRDFPEYRGKPLAVGGSPEGRGVVAAASYEARVFGVRSAMPSHKAIRLCPHILFVRPRFDVYKKVSGSIREIFRRYTDLIEPLSLDEAYLDVSYDKLGIGSALDIAKEIREAIREELQLTASAGISINKFVAKIASDINKPDGITFIGPSKIEAFMEALPVGKFHGVGKVTARKMGQMNLHTGADLKRLSEHELVKHFGKQGHFYYRIVRGIDDRPVQPNRETKSISVEDTFEHDLTRLVDMDFELEKIAERLASRLQKHQLKCRTITLKIRFNDFSIINRSKSLSHNTGDLSIILQTAKELLSKELSAEDKRVRLLGITLSNFHEVIVIDKNPKQLRLFK